MSTGTCHLLFLMLFVIDHVPDRRLAPDLFIKTIVVIPGLTPGGRILFQDILENKNLQRYFIQLI